MRTLHRPHGKHRLYCCWRHRLRGSVFTKPLLRNGLHNPVVPPLLGADDIENTASFIVACWTVFTELLPGNALFKSRCFMVGLLWQRCLGYPSSFWTEFCLPTRTENSIKLILAHVPAANLLIRISIYESKIGSDVMCFRISRAVLERWIVGAVFDSFLWLIITALVSHSHFIVLDPQAPDQIRC
jgi:hypothetical protein